MALDAQQNWTVEMAESLERSRLGGGAWRTKQIHLDESDGDTEDSILVPSDVTAAAERNCKPLYLPDEILIHILEYVSHIPSAQQTLASCCKISHQWYDNTVPLLYRHPQLHGKNFDLFVRTICPSINLHVRKSPLSNLVKILDLGQLVHQSSKSITARLLGRTKGSLEEFRAPQASFAINCLPALAKCLKLRRLDLSLVSESPPLPNIFKAVAQLANLQIFHLPRSSGFGVHHQPDTFVWPSQLQELCLSGGIDAHFLHGVVSFPPTLRSLTIEYCPGVKVYSVTHLLKTAVAPLKQLKRFRIAHMRRLWTNSLDGVLAFLPQISSLSISVDYTTPALFDGKPAIAAHLTLHNDFDTPSADVKEHTLAYGFVHHNLEMLELTNSGSSSGIEDKITPIDVLIALEQGCAPKLRQVHAARSLLWQEAEVEALADELRERAESSETNGKMDVGVWIIDG